jgi:adenylate kinase
VRERLKIYHQQTKPLINFYQQLAQQGLTHYSCVNGWQEVDEVKKQILAILKQ